MNKILIFLFLAIGLSAQTVPLNLQQPPGTYTNNSVLIRDGTANKVKNASAFTYVTSALPGAANSTVSIGDNSGDTRLLITGRNTAGNTANTIDFELRDGSNVFTQGYQLFFEIGAQEWENNYWSTLSSDYVTSFRFNPATNVTTFDNGLSAPVITSTVATGTAPLVVASTTQVANLNAATAGSATTATTATNAINTAVTDDTSTNATMYPTWVTATTGNLPQKLSSTKLTFNPSTGLLTATGMAATSPAFTTSLTTPSTTFALLNATATTINAFGAATTVNTGASATQIWNFGGSTTASEFRFLEPSGSGTNYSAFKAVAQGANITYSLPATVGASGTVLTDAAGNGVLSWAAAGSGTVTVVGAGSLTSTALVTGGGTTTLQTPSATATMDSSGNISTPGSITSGAGAATAGFIGLGQGTAPSTGTTNIKIYAPTSVTSYTRRLVGSAGTGFYLGTATSTDVVDTQVASTGSGSVVLGTTPTINGNTYTTATATSVGYIGMPQNSQSAAYTTVLADQGKHILHPTADNNARTFTIDSNANVAYPVGTVITVVNQINTVTIAITSDTLTWFAGSGTASTGSRSLAAGGVATLLKVSATGWIISGPGVS